MLLRKSGPGSGDNTAAKERCPAAWSHKRGEDLGLGCSQESSSRALQSHGSDEANSGLLGGRKWELAPAPNPDGIPNPCQAETGGPSKEGVRRGSRFPPVRGQQVPECKRQVKASPGTPKGWLTPPANRQDQVRRAPGHTHTGHTHTRHAQTRQKHVHTRQVHRG